MSRRRFLALAGGSTVAMAAGPSLLASCGSDGDAASRAPTSSPTVPTTVLDPDRPWWLQGNFAPVEREVEAHHLAVQGQLPRALDGLYVRNGSNARNADNGHWFLGDGMLHGIRLEDGKARWYRNRWVDTTLYEQGTSRFTGAPGGDKSFSNVSVFLHAGKLLTSGEIGFPYHVRPTDLSTVGVYDFAGRLTTSMTAHPKIDPETGRMHFFGYGFTEPFLTYHVADATGRLMSSQQIDVAGPTMIHDFAITDRDAIFWEFPVVFSMDMAIAGERFPYKWDPSYGARIGVMPLGGPTSAIRWVEVPPAYVFHGVNAHRDGDDVVVDVAQYHEMFEHGPLGSAPKLHRWHLRTGGTSLTIDDEVLEGERRLELPTRDPRRVGRANRYGWFLEVTDPATPDGPPEFHGLARRDFQTGTLDRWDPGPAIAAGEGLFVPDGDDAGESDGWLLTYTYDRAEATGAFVVLRADDVAAGPVATVGLPQRVPYGFHATWVPAATGLLT